MVDYDKSTGTTATMRIRDTGTTVEFWFTSGNNSSYNHRLPWRFYINGVQGSWTYHRYTANKGWVRFGSWNVTTTQEVTFELGRSGTGGMGGPTTHKVTINRITGPPQTNPFIVSSATSSSVSGRATNNRTGGLPVLEWQIGYGDSPRYIRHYGNLDLNGFGTISKNIEPGSLLYIWNRLRTAKGWSIWSGRTQIQLKKPPEKLAKPVISNLNATYFTAKWGVNGHGGSPITHYRYQYGPTNPPTKEGIVYSPTAHMYNLSPGSVNYFRVLAANAMGEGPWSDIVSATTKGGSTVRVNGKMKGAIPFVRHQGTWRPAEVWVKIAGMWKRTE